MKHKQHHLWVFILIILGCYSNSYAQTPIINLPFNGNTSDISGNGLNGTNNNATLTTDRFNTPNAAYYFNGTNASIDIAYNNKFNFAPTGQFSISCWVLPALANSISALVVKSPFNSNFYLSLWDYGLYLINNKGMSGYANNNFLTGNTVMLPNGCWYHLLVTYNNGIWTLYLNGKLEATDYSQTRKILQSNGGLSIGKKGESNGDFFQGKLDDIKIYNVELTAAQIKSLTCYAGPDITNCKGDSSQFQATTTGTNNTWIPTTYLSNPSILNPYAKPPNQQQYILRSEQGTGCYIYDTVIAKIDTFKINLGPDQFICQGDSFVFNNTTVGTYNWSPIYNINDNTIPNPIVRPLISIDYRVTFNNGQCISRDTIHFDVTKVFSNAGIDTSICVGDSVQLNGVATGLFHWTPNTNISNINSLNPYVKPNTNTKYVLISTASSCVKTDTVEVKIINNVPAFAGNDTSLCEGSSIQLNGSGGNGGTWLTKYRLSNPSISNPIASPLTDTNYIYRSYIGTGCFGYDTMHVSIIPFPKVDAGNNLHYCFNGSAQFNPTVSAYDSLNWFPVSGLNQSNILQPITNTNNNRWYFLTLWNKGCSAIDSVWVQVEPKLIANFTANPSVGIAPCEISFNNTSNGGNKFFWDLGDTLTTSYSENTKHTYTKPGSYLIYFSISDSLGCKDSLTKTIQIFFKPYLFVPNAITPNKDGLNDFFEVTWNPEGFESLNCKIINRWGEIIFETNMPNGVWWDGTYKGKECQQDVYEYIITATDLTGKAYNLRGTIQLLR